VPLRYPRNDDWDAAAIRLVPTVWQQQQLDETWRRMTRLMAWVDVQMRETGCVQFVQHYKSYVAHLEQLPDAQGMSHAMLVSIVRTVSRHHTGHEAGAERDWSKAETIAIAGRVARMLVDFDYLSIQTHGGRLHVAYLPVNGSAAVFRQEALIFHWARLNEEHALLYLPREYARSIERRTVRFRRQQKCYRRAARMLSGNENSRTDLHLNAGTD
jgi:hypothetical protein